MKLLTKMATPRLSKKDIPTANQGWRNNMFIATYEEYQGTGDTLEEAAADLEQSCDISSRYKEDITFYNATPIEVEYKIQLKHIPKIKDGK